MALDKMVVQANSAGPQRRRYICSMSSKLSGWDDTIVALATPPGVGALGIIRVSGAEAYAIVNGMFPSKDLRLQPANTLHVGVLKDDQLPLDEVVVSLFHSPKSYTGEDLIEISAHGSAYLQQQIIAACIRRGARLAKAGEFTQRAFLNGKLDLVQAEAVADLIASNTAASQRAALHSVRGGFSEVLKDLREKLIQFAALLELELDFAMEDVEFADRTQFHQLIEEAIQTTGQLVESFQFGNVVKNGVSVAIVGKPNAGKSTLLNALLNEERAIVSEIAGTTRDSIEELLNINGIIFRLIDTAGIRAHSTDQIELAGMARSHDKIRSSDIVIYLFDMSVGTDKFIGDGFDALAQSETKWILVGNKADMSSNTGSISSNVNDVTSVIKISAKHGQGLDVLKTRLYELAAGPAVNTESTIVTNTRHHEALQKISQALKSIRTGLDNGLSSDLLAAEIRYALHHISLLTGDVSNEDVLGYIFGKFCIGK